MRWKIGCYSGVPQVNLHDVQIIVETYRHDGMYWAECEISDDVVFSMIFPFARALASFLEDHRELWLGRILRQQFHYLSAGERLWVLGRALQILSRGETNQDTERIDRMTITLMLFMSEHHTVIVEGVQDFLLPDVREELLSVLGQAADDYFLEHEHREYIQFLRVFSERQHSRAAAVHIRYGDLVMTDDKGELVGQELIECLRDGLPPDNDDKELQDELLVSALVTLAPSQIVLHGNFPHAFGHMLRDIFPGRVLSNVP